MILAILTYKKDLFEVDKYLPEHITFLDNFYQQKKFLASGRRDNRVGGIIVILANDLDEAKEIIKSDPFYQNDVADYELIRFEPSKYLPEIQNLI